MTPSALLPLDDALDLLRNRLSPVTPVETVPLAEAAGRVLARPVVARVTVPPLDNSAVDGYAVHAADIKAEGETRLPVTARVAAGHPLGHALARGEAARIFTGAPLPDGADTVVMQEVCRLDGGAVVFSGATVKPGANRRRAGEDFAAGAELLTPGRRLRPLDLGLAAAAGHAALEVHRPLRVAVFSTGDEIREPPQPLAPGQIYDINRTTVAALLRGLGCRVTDLGILPDRVAAIRDALRQAAAGQDLLVTSGGVSVGDEDHVKAACDAMDFWRLAIKPGKPIALGNVAGVPLLGLPGNPAASMVTFLVVGRAVALRLMGCAEAAPLRYPLPATFSFRRQPGRREFLRGRLVAGPRGLAVDKVAADGSGIVSSMTAADGLIDIAADIAEICPGDAVAFLPFAEVL